MLSLHLSVCLFCSFFWLNVDCTEHVYTFFKCINSALSLKTLPVSFQSSDWKQLSSNSFALIDSLKFNYLIKLIITIKYSFLFNQNIFLVRLLFSHFGWSGHSNFLANTHTQTHTHTLSFIYIDDDVQRSPLAGAQGLGLQ